MLLPLINNLLSIVLTPPDPVPTHIPEIKNWHKQKWRIDRAQSCPVPRKSQSSKSNFAKSCISCRTRIFSCMPNIEEISRNLINWYILLIEPQNHLHRRQHFTRNQNPPNQITLQKQLSWCILKSITQLLRYSNLRRKNHIAFSHIHETLWRKKRRYLPS